MASIETLPPEHAAPQSTQEMFRQAQLETDARREHHLARIALTAMAIAAPLTTITHREFGPANPASGDQLSEQELDRVGATKTSEVVEQERDIRLDADNVLLPRLTFGEQTTTEHTLTVKVDEKWAEWFSADKDAGKPMHPEDPHNAVDFVAGAIAEPGEFQDSVWKVLRDHKDLFAAQPTEITEVEITGHASAEDNTSDAGVPGERDAGLTTPSPDNVELAQTRQEEVAPEIVEELQDLGVNPEQIEYGAVEDTLSENEVADVDRMVEQYGYADALEMVKHYNRSPEEVPPEVKAKFDTMLKDERYVDVSITYRTTEGNEYSISLPWFVLPLAAMPPRSPRPPTHPPRPPSGPPENPPSGPPNKPPRPPVTPSTPPVPPHRPPRRDRRQQQQFGHNGRGYGLNPATKSKQPHAQNFTPNNLGRVQNSRKGVRGVARARGGNRFGKRG